MAHQKQFPSVKVAARVLSSLCQRYTEEMTHINAQTSFGFGFAGFSLGFNDMDAIASVAANGSVNFKYNFEESMVFYCPFCHKHGTLGVIKEGDSVSGVKAAAFAERVKSQVVEKCKKERK